MRIPTAALALAISITVMACGVDPFSALARQLTWQPVKPVPGIVDLAGPRSDGRFVVSSLQGLSLFGRKGIAPFAFPDGPGSYAPPPGDVEPDVALTPKLRLRGAGCGFHRDEAYALANNTGQLIRITRAGLGSIFASVPGSRLVGLAFDRVGTFGHRLLVISSTNERTALYAVDCRGRVSPVVADGPRVEGGIEVAPRSFGRFGGRLIAVDEVGGGVFAFGRNGTVALVAAPTFPAGGDLGVESVGFVPEGLGKRGAAFLADRAFPQSASYPGTESILRVGGSALSGAGVRAGDLLVATEGGAETAAVRCRKGKRCAVRTVGTGPDVTHAEGHIVFRPAR
jgi:hypothetical protein